MAIRNLIHYSWQHWRCFPVSTSRLTCSVPEPAGKGALSLACTDAEETDDSDGTAASSQDSMQLPLVVIWQARGECNFKWHTKKQGNICIFGQNGTLVILDLMASPAGILAKNSKIHQEHKKKQNNNNKTPLNFNIKEQFTQKWRLSHYLHFKTNSQLLEVREGMNAAPEMFPGLRNSE